jgi:ABC-type multidrug transport system fused ATPase/permease subunit
MAMAVSLIYWRVGIYYVRTARECRRLLASSRSPLYTAFGEALDGIVTVRAFSAEKGLLNVSSHRKHDADFSQGMYKE